MMEKNIEETLSESEESKEDNGSVSPNDQLKNEDGSKDIETFCENSTQDDQLKNEDGSKDIETFCENSTQDDPLKKGDIESLCESTTQGETSLGDELCNQDPDTQDGEEAMTDVAIELEDGAKHISIQRELRHLEALVDSDGEKKPCPLCPEGRFKPCHITKLLRHLQNMHWEISTDFEDYRMCICYLPCLQSTAQNENELPSRTCAHYHCIICSRPVARRIKMIRHIKRHVEKGETQVKPSSGRRQEIFHESNTEFRVLPNFTTPQISGTFFNPVMKTNRQLILCALAVLAEEREPLECLDAFSSTGIMGLQWAKHLGNLVKVTVNDISDSSVAMIQENCLLNKMKVVMKSKEQSEAGPEIKEGGDDYVGEIEVTQMDANVLMHMRSFDFIHLDPFGTSVNYLDAAFRNVRNLGIVSVTSTDTGSLYAKTVHVAKRHYGCDIIRTEYFRELGTRIVLSAIARAAARCNKGIEVLLSVALEHFVLVIVRVQRGPSLADESLKMINNLIHCHWCEERIFQKEGNMVEENPYNQLPCDCHKSMPGRSAVMLGPLWSGPLFNAGFLREMLLEAGSHGVGEILNLLKTLIYESVCTNLKQFSISPSQAEESGVFIKIPGGEVLVDPGKRKRQDINTIAAKRLKTDIRVEQPPFYYSIHRHAIGGLNIPKLNKIMQYIVGAGYLVSRTHFDPTGIRTNAPLAKLKAILEKNSTVSNTSQSGGYKETPETHSEEAPSEETASVSDGGYKETPETHSEEAPSEETASVSETN